jgi:hypothetical protein
MRPFFICVVFTLAAGFAHADGPIIFSRLASIDLNQTQCLERASILMKEAGFTENFAEDTSAVWGMQKSTSGHIRCAAEDKTVLFVVAGKYYSTTAELFKKLHIDFDVKN